MKSRVRFEIEVVTEDFGYDLNEAMKSAPEGTIWKSLGKDENTWEMVAISIPYERVQDFIDWYGENPLEGQDLIDWYASK